MKVLLVNSSDKIGGAARAVYRLHKSLLDKGIDSQMLVLKKESDDFTVIGPSTYKEKIISRIAPYIDYIPVRKYKKRRRIIFSPAWAPGSSIVKKINDINPDIVHLNWICGGMIKLEDLKKINAPIIWSLHDNWPFTGGCHIMLECRKYQDKCGDCPQLLSKKNNDLSRKILIRKKKAYSKIKNILIVTKSKWLEDCVRKSVVLKNKKVKTIPNPLNTSIYKPSDILRSRKLWSLPLDKKLILFGAMNGISDINKGYNYLCKALEKINTKNVELVVFGSLKPKDDLNFKYKTYYMGHLSDDISLVTLYSSVDVMVVPSLQEAFGQTASEAMACGTPVVCFDTTGLKDIVDHKKNGYRAKSFNSEDFANGIDWVLSTSNYEDLCQNAREKVVKEFESSVVANKYIELYNEI